MKFKYLFLIVFLAIHTIGSTQTSWEFGYSFGTNGTTARTIKHNDMTWGYSTPAYPSTWVNHWTLGFGTKKNKIHLAFDGGSLGIGYKISANPDKFPLQEFDGTNNPKYGLSLRTRIGSISRSNTNLLKFSLFYSYVWAEKKKFQHKSILGGGFLKTRVNTPLRSTGAGDINDSLGLISHNFIIDKYAYLRKTNLYLIAGYECSYALGNRFAIKASIIYNQGLFKMVKWHSYREYKESLTNYTEFDEQWSYTRLSHYSILTGLSYTIGNDK